MSVVHLELMVTTGSTVCLSCSGPGQRPDTWDHGSHPGQRWGAAEADTLPAIWGVSPAEQRGAAPHHQLTTVSAGKPHSHIMVQCPERMNLYFFFNVYSHTHTHTHTHTYSGCWLNQANKHGAPFPNTLHNPAILPVLSAGYEHVQQCPGVGAARAPHEPVRPACWGCWRCQQRRSVFCPHTRRYLVTACGLLGIYRTVEKQSLWRGDKLFKCVDLCF